jgi:digeranylgeranylglycerophospholipid reductase
LYDAIIIGGGPSGLQTASILADSGFRVVLFDMNSEIGIEVVCSGVLSAEAFSRYDLPKQAIVGRLKDANLYSPAGISIPYSHPEESVVVVDRKIFDKKLAERASKNGAEIRLNCKVSSVTVNDRYVKVDLKTLEGEMIACARICVIATGVNYHLQRSLGLGRPKKIIKGIQLEVDSIDLDRLSIYWGRKYSNGFFGWAIPLLDGRTRIGVMTEGNSQEALANTLSEFTYCTKSCTNTGRPKMRGIGFGTIHKSYSDRIIVVGEAAGQIKTTTGGGIYFGLIAAEIGSEVITKAFKKASFEARTLAEYEKKWKKMLGWEITFGEYFHKFYSKLDDRSLDELFVAAKEDALLSFIAKNGKFDWHRKTIIQIMRSPNLRRVLFNGFMRLAKTKEPL